ncbi:MAG TPA: orotate phosphoribosyltransferase [Marinilabiliales bacterium]|nr:MAG: orotate phosphoribosyltransferase [Bacteroidetes bacterium GWA2_40_14]OFX72326.1 MAG: orotate phosphoribosyltransferase [Bacteroidetes bacterium GWD2_40_43]OFX90426.1 MAG: orotate phosphoribosyltransferase [Bacteroidetes bacterium GWE2_40_63]OFY17328.1 MAG: orotate phosphoribosyltransferase [Bacteroidetes bacterium GWF2_40_13]OFZ27327.1 MAG: orotate phosphoribosyltransferase [Bacteroidetes bacterium RIFOXYC2_FULL_40_12]HAN00899.1 orotate phosphoribosyltransferase [Marinilabiliales bact
MTQTNEIAKKVATQLLQINAIKLSPTSPFTWASGMKSPIYCDNRKTLSFPEARDIIRDAFVQAIQNQYSNVEVIAGVATGAIAHGVLVAQALNKPFVYVRSDAKKHGLENLVEGHLEKGQSVVVIEDLISTGGSSLKAVEALRNAGARVEGLLAIFSYGFAKASESFIQANCAFGTLSNYPVLVDLALETGYIKSSDLELLRKWRENPDQWL